jgi:hypothetical protein
MENIKMYKKLHVEGIIHIFTFYHGEKQINEEAFAEVYVQ